MHASKNCVRYQKFFAEGPHGPYWGLWDDFAKIRRQQVKVERIDLSIHIEIALAKSSTREGEVGCEDIEVDGIDPAVVVGVPWSRWISGAGADGEGVLADVGEESILDNGASCGCNGYRLAIRVQLLSPAVASHVHGVCARCQRHADYVTRIGAANGVMGVG